MPCNDNCTKNKFLPFLADKVPGYVSATKVVTEN